MKFEASNDDRGVRVWVPVEAMHEEAYLGIPGKVWRYEDPMEAIRDGAALIEIGLGALRTRTRRILEEGVVW